MTAKAAWLIGGVVALAVAVLLVVRGIEESWSAEIILAVGALYVSIGGFVIAIAEIHRARSVSQATEMAIQGTLNVVAAGHLAVTVTHLRHAVDELEIATNDNKTDGALDAVNTWRNLIVDARGPFRRQFPSSTDVLDAIQHSLNLGQQVKGKLSEAEDRPLRPITGECLASMEQVANDLGELVGELTPAIGAVKNA